MAARLSIAFAITAVLLSACSEPPVTGAEGSPTTGSSMITTVELGGIEATGIGEPATTAPDVASTTPTSTTTTTTTTTIATATNATTPAPAPKPAGDPLIVLLPPSPVVRDGSDTTEYFRFASVGGYESYRVVQSVTYEGRQGNANQWAGRFEATVDGTTLHFRAADREGRWEAVATEDLFLYREGGGDWIPLLDDHLDGAMPLMAVLPDFQHPDVFAVFETLTFVDWDIVDGAWYARYSVSPDFLARFGGAGPEIANPEGHVWISPAGFMHSYLVTYEVPGENAIVELSWRLSELGTATVDLPSELAPVETTTP